MRVSKLEILEEFAEAQARAPRVERFQWFLAQRAQKHREVNKERVRRLTLLLRLRRSSPPSLGDCPCAACNAKRKRFVVRRVLRVEFYERVDRKYNDGRLMIAGRAALECGHVVERETNPAKPPKHWARCYACAA
jgi:hypothetical protein